MKSTYHWVWRAYLNMSVHYFKKEVPKYIFSLIKIFKIARQTLFVYLFVFVLILYSSTLKNYFFDGATIHEE